MSVKVSLNFITGLVALPTTRFVAYSTVEFLASGFLYRFRFNLNGGGGTPYQSTAIAQTH